ncbi:MAG: hypothetical protein AB1798_19125 [Spirochaetota bacterium]
MNVLDVNELLKKIFSGYLNTAKKLVVVLLFLALTGLTSAIVVFPLWYLATEHREVFTILVFFLFLSLVIFAVVMKVIRAFRPHQNPKEKISAFLRRFSARLLILLFFLSAVYLLAFLYTSGILLAAVPLTILFILILGYILYGRKYKNQGPDQLR